MHMEKKRISEHRLTEQKGILEQQLELRLAHLLGTGAYFQSVIGNLASVSS